MDPEIWISWFFFCHKRLFLFFPWLFKIVKTIHIPCTLQKQIGFYPWALVCWPLVQRKKKKEGLSLQEIAGDVSNWTKFWRIEYKVKTIGGQREYNTVRHGSEGVWRSGYEMHWKGWKESCYGQRTVKSGTRWIGRDNQRPDCTELCRRGKSTLFELAQNNIFSLDYLLLFEKVTYTFLNDWTLMRDCIYIFVYLYIYFIHC